MIQLNTIARMRMRKGRGGKGGEKVKRNFGGERERIKVKEKKG